MPSPITLDLESSQQHDFRVVFDQAQSIDFYGHKVPPFHTALCRGVMPHNNIGSLKLLNAIGSHLRQQEQKAFKLSHTRSMPPLAKFSYDADMAINAHTALILQAMGAIEKYRTLDQPCPTKEIAEKLNAITHDTITHLQSLIKEPLSHQKTQRVTKLIKTLEQQKTSLTNTLNTLPTPITDLLHQRLFRKILKHYDRTQNRISAWQGFKLNESHTEAYQNASQALQNHLYSTQIPNDSQLWVLPEPLPEMEAMPIILDTSHYDESFKRDDLLFSVSQSDANPDEFYQSHKKSIHDRQIHDKSGAIKAKETPAQIDEKLTTYFKTALDDYKKKHPDHFDAGGHLKSEQIIVDSFIRDIIIQALAHNPSFIPKENPVHLHASNDLFSSIGSAAEMISSYFAQEMAAKHPGITFTFFCLTSIALGSVFLTALPGTTLPAQYCLQTLSAFLNKISMGQISTTTIQTAFINIENELSIFTNNNAGFQSLLMDALGLPKIAFIIGEELFSTVDTKTTLDKLSEKTRSDDLLYSTSEEKYINQCVKTGKIVLALSIITGAGILGGILGTLPYLKPVGDIIGTVSEINLSNFDNIVNNNGVLADVAACTAALLAIYASSVSVGKLYLISQQTFKANEDPKIIQRMKAMSALYTMYNSNTEHFTNTIRVMNSIVPNSAATLYKAIDELQRTRPELFLQMPKIEECMALLNNTTANDIPQETQESTLDALTSSSLEPNKSLIPATKPSIPAPTTWEKFKNGMQWISTFLWERLLAPPISTVLLLPLLLMLPFKRDILKTDIGKSTLYHASKFGRFLISIMVLLWNSAKMFSIATFGTLMLVAKAFISAFFSATLCINAMLLGPRAIGLLTALEKLAAVPLYALLKIGSFLSKCIKYALQIPTLASMIVIAALFLIAAPFYAIAAWITDGVQGFKKQFNALWTDLAKAGITNGGLLLEKIGAPFNTFSERTRSSAINLEQQDNALEEYLCVNTTGAFILNARDNALTGLNNIQSTVKHVFGQAIFNIRSTIIRPLNTFIQQMGTEYTHFSPAPALQDEPTCPDQPSELPIQDTNPHRPSPLHPADNHDPQNVDFSNKIK